MGADMDIIQLLSRKRMQGWILQLIGAICAAMGWQFNEAAWAEILGIVLLIAGYAWQAYGSAKAERPLSLRASTTSTASASSTKSTSSTALRGPS